MTWKFKMGELVEKATGDYRYKGWVVGRIKKRNGMKRYVVENVDGMLFIFAETQLILGYTFAGKLKCK